MSKAAGSATREEAAVLRTLLYSDLFDYPLTANEIHQRLIGVAAKPETVHTLLAESDWLAGRVERVNGYFAVSGRGSKVADLRAARRAASNRLWRQARRYGRLLAHLPFVRLVAVTGALAVDNSDAGDDIDYLIVSATGRVWLARALSILVVRLGRVFGVNLCPNYLLSERALSQSQRDLFTAHELAQMVPLCGAALFAEMRAVNAWAQRYLPNAGAPLRAEADLTPRGAGRWLQRAAEWLLAGRLGDRLEAWERERKLRRFAVHVRRPGSTAELDADRVKGHFDDYGGPALQRYRAQLSAHGLHTFEG